MLDLRIVLLFFFTLWKEVVLSAEFCSADLGGIAIGFNQCDLTVIDIPLRLSR